MGIQENCKRQLDRRNSSHSCRPFWPSNLVRPTPALLGQNSVSFECYECMGSGIRVYGLASPMHAFVMQCGLNLTRHWHQCQYCTVIHFALVCKQTSTVLEALFVCRMLWVQRVQGLACEIYAFLSQYGLDLNRNIDINGNLAPWFTLPWISYKQRRHFLKHSVCRM